MADQTQITTGLVRFSFLQCWEPKTAPKSTVAKYSVQLLIPKKDKENVAKINAAIEAVKKTEYALKQWGGKVPAEMKMPLRDGDKSYPDDPTYAGMYFLNANNTKQPGVVDRQRNPILDKSEMYSGVWGLAAINFYGFNAEGSKGIACSLQHLMKVKDGEALAGGVTVDEAFGDVKLPEEDFM